MSGDGMHLVGQAEGRRRTPEAGKAHGGALAALLLGAPLAIAALLAAQPPPQQGSGPTAPGPAQQQPGSAPGVYAKYCAQCHGDKGDGLGIAAPYLQPAPRDFTSGKYQVRSTPTGALPTDADLRRVIQQGIPGTAMPAFHNLSDQQVDAVIAEIKAFSPKFAAGAPQPVALPKDPGFKPDGVEAARKVYQSIGCAGCHGAEGRGDGPSAPTLRDDWGQAVRPADLSRPWTFNGGASREDIFRSITTGLNGTPMAGFQSALSDEQRWALVDFITALADGKTEPGFANLMVASRVEGELDLAKGKELFAAAEPALFPVFGQIVQPGRDFQPAVVAVEARAVYNADEVALLVTWHDTRKDVAGSNGPDFELPAEEELPGRLLGAASGAASGGAAADPFAGEEPAAADPFAGEESAPPAADPFAGEEASAAAPAAQDPFAEEATGGAVGGGAGAAAAAEFSDAVAVQFPRELADGPRRPYFLFGDAGNPVELWFVDLASPARAELWEGRGSSELDAAEGITPEVRASFEKGEWSVLYKRKRTAGRGISFRDDTFVPIAFSVWDGSHRERGNRRGLTSWYNLYVPPADQPSPYLPMARAAGIVLFLELIVIVLVRRRVRATAAAAPAPAGTL